MQTLLTVVTATRWTIGIVTPPCIWHSYRRRGCAVHAQVLPSPVCSEPAPNKWFLGRTWVHIQSDTSVGSSVFVELTVSSVYSTHVDFGEIPFPSLPVPLSFLPSLPSPLEVGTPTATWRSGGERISLMTNYSCDYCPLKESFHDILVINCPGWKKDLEQIR